MAEEALFYADYPLWTLYDEALAQRLGMPDGIPILNPPGVGTMLPLFTDVDLAQRFIEDARRPDVTPLAIREPLGLLAIVEHFQRKGIQHVGIDLSLHPGGVQLHPIGDFIAEQRRRGQA